MSKFQFLSFSALSSNFEDLKNAELKKYQVKTVNELPTGRKEQLQSLIAIIDQIKSLEITDKQKSLILTGAMLDLKAKIAYSYSGPWKLVTSPDNSTVYKGIDSAIGMNDVNLMDADSSAAALNSYKEFTFILSQIKNPAHDKINVNAKLTHDLTLEKQLAYVNSHPFYLEPTFTDEKQDKLRRMDIGDMSHYIHMNSEMKRMYKLANILEKEIKDENLLGKTIKNATALNREVKDFNHYLLTPTMTRQQEHDLVMGQDNNNPKYYADKDLAEHQASEKKRLFKEFGPQVRMFHPRRLHHVETHETHEQVVKDVNIVKMKKA